MAFESEIETELLGLQTELAERSYRPGEYREFTVYERKPRLISAAPYRDRVVHHALCNVIEPIFESAFIYDSYACREAKGTHRAVDRFSQFARRTKYVLKTDIRKYFPSIDHAILIEKIGRKIKCPDTLWLVGLIVEGSNPQEQVADYFPGDTPFTPFVRRKGIPIGNLTSQFFANVYLDDLDHFVKERLQCRHYIRYVDDLAVFDNDKERLWEIKERIEEFLLKERLRLHPKKTYVAPVWTGIDHLGYRIYPTHRRLRKDNSLRFKARLKSLARLYGEGKIDWLEINPRVQSWIGHAKHADTWGLRRAIFNDIPFSRGALSRENKGDMILRRAGL